MRALKVCSCMGCAAHQGSCPQLTPTGRCQPCDRTADRARGTAHQRGYSSTGHKRFRAAVLRRDKTCRIDGCNKPSTDADHWPQGRDELIRLGLDPNDARYGRGLCATDHKRETAKHQPGGWHRR
jgi:5-methylcytosine-specific restriction protein A